MLKRTALGLAAAVAITASALSATTTTAQAGGNLVIKVHGWHGGHGWHGHRPWRLRGCYRWKRKYFRTGNPRFLRRYRRCVFYRYW